MGGGLAPRGDAGELAGGVAEGLAPRGDAGELAGGAALEVVGASGFPPKNALNEAVKDGRRSSG